MSKVLVYGFYYKDNLGDDLFIDAFKKIFPELEFEFVNQITESALNGVSTVFIGGGSFLFAEPKFTPGALTLLKDKNIFYISVGGETDIHPIHLELMQKAKLIAIRNEKYFRKIDSINSNTIIIPDIVYALGKKTPKIHNLKKKVLIIPNLSVVPKWSDEHWKHASWSYFKSEFAQFLDFLIETKNRVNFLAMSVADNLDDTWAATEIISHMQHRSGKMVIDHVSTADKAIDLISQYDLVISQRFHGIILAELARVPCLTIHHHDKLKNSYLNEGSFISYYGLSKQMLIDQFNKTIHMECVPDQPIESNIFEDLKGRVLKLIG